MDYTEIKYVNKRNGSDEIGDGSAEYPFATLTYCLDNISTSNPAIYINEGIYDINSFPSLAISGTTINLFGSWGTIIEVSNSVRSTLNGDLNIYSCIIRPKNELGGNTDYLYYFTGSAVKTVNFYNVCFTKSKSGVYPSNTLFKASGNYSLRYFTYNNCSFVGNFSTTDSWGGNSTFNNCAIQTTNNYGILTNTKQGCIFNENYYIVDLYGNIVNDNHIYGVYSGDYSVSRILLKKDNKYYSINLEYYNEQTKDYDELIELKTSDWFFVNQLFSEVTINEETFKPTDKFDNFSIVIPSLPLNHSIKIEGIKSNKELIVQAFDINTSLYQNIISLSVEVNSPSYSSIKIVFSKDMGETWFTIVDNNIVATDCIIPKKNYKGMDNEEKLKYISARETISEVGFSPDILRNFDFNLINADKIRFAYVLFTISYDNNPSLLNLKSIYNEKGFMQLIKDSECDVELFENSIKIKSYISCSLIEADVII